MPWEDAEPEADVLAFLEGQAKKLQATHLVTRATLTPGLEASNLLKKQKIPCALISDGGGEMDKANGVLWNKFMDVTIINKGAKDPLGTDALKKTLKLARRVMDALDPPDNDDVRYVEDTDSEPILTEGGEYLVLKTLRFSYTLRRASAEEEPE